MKRGNFMAGLAGLALLSAALPGYARDGWFVQLAAGSGGTEYGPNYSFANGQAPMHYNDEKQGGAAGVGAGYRRDINARFSVDFAAEWMHQGSEWTLDLPSESASFKYGIPNVLALRVTPSWVFADRWRLFADFGLARGQVKEGKTSPVGSSYQFNDWVNASLVGAGISYDVNDKVSLGLSWRRLQFDSLGYQSHLPNGTQWESIVDEPVNTITSLVLTWHF